MPRTATGIVRGAGFWAFAVSMVVVVVAWVAASPFTLRRPRVVQRVGQALVRPRPEARWVEDHEFVGYRQSI